MSGCDLIKVKTESGLIIPLIRVWTPLAPEDPPRSGAVRYKLESGEEVEKVGRNTWMHPITKAFFEFYSY